MRNTFLTLLLILCTSAAAFAEDGAGVTVTPLQLPAGSNTGTITGNINTGVKIPMRWAENSSVALVPGTRFEQFDGNQVFYRIEMPASSVIKLKMTPAKGKKINLYALRQGVNPPHQVPPNVTSAISSEASYPIYANMGGGRKVSNKDKGYREVEFMSVNNPYSILIGVSGAEGETEGEFQLNIEVVSR